MDDYYDDYAQCDIDWTLKAWFDGGAEVDPFAPCEDDWLKSPNLTSEDLRAIASEMSDYYQA